MADAQVAIITGGGSGIGKHSALALLEEGWSVVLAGRRSERLDQVISEAGATDRMLGVQTDVADPTTIPPAPIRPNRMQVVTAFSGRVEPLSTPTFSPLK